MADVKTNASKSRGNNSLADLGNPATGKKKGGFFQQLGRLFGGPVRALLTLVFLVLPGLLGLSGGLDYLNSKFYELQNDGAADPRPGVIYLQCLLLDEVKRDEQSVSLRGRCNQAEQVGSIAGTLKQQLWPFEQRVPASSAEGELYWYGGMLFVALLGYMLIGNPDFMPEQTDRDKKAKTRKKTKEAEELDRLGLYRSVKQ